MIFVKILGKGDAREESRYGKIEIISCDRAMEDWESTSRLQPPVGEGDRKQEYKTMIPLDFQTALQILSYGNTGRFYSNS